MTRKGRTLAIISMAILCSGSLIAASACTVTPQDEGPEVYKLTYAPGAEDVTVTEPAEVWYAEGTTVTLKSADLFVREGYTFEAWEYAEETYEAGATFTMPASDVTFTALWKEEEEALPEGTETVESIPAGALKTVNGNATANWFADYTEEGVSVTAWVEDANVYTRSSVYQNDSIEVIVANVGRYNAFSEKTISVTVDAAGNTAISNLGTGETLTSSGVSAKATLISTNGKTLAGYRVEITVPYALAGVDQAAKDAALALGITNASNAANANSVFDSTYGTERNHVNTYIALTGKDTFEENPYLDLGNIWGAGGSQLPMGASWDIAHDDGTENAYIEMTTSIGDNYIYMKGSNETNVYAEVKLHAEANTINKDEYPKFGLTLTKANSESTFFYFVDAVANASGGTTINSNAVNLDYVTKGTGDWQWPEKIVGNLGNGATSELYTGEGNFVTLGIYRQGNQIVLTYNSEAIGDPIFLNGIGATDAAYIGLASFNIKLTAKGYYVTTDEEVLAKYRVPEYIPPEETDALKTMDGSMNDWTEAEKSNPFILPSDQGRSVTVYAAKDANGVNIFFDVYHLVHKSMEIDWFNNTNVEFRLGGDANKQYAIAANGFTANLKEGNYFFGTTAPAEEGGFYHTVAEIFVPYSEISGYTADSAYVPANFYFKIGGVFGNVWETGDWWRAGGNNEQGLLITENGFLGGTAKTIDADDSDWADATWTTVGRSEWAATLEDDGLYVIIKLTQDSISNERAFVNGADGTGSNWWLNQNVEIQGTADLRAARIVWFEGKAYHTPFVNEAAGKYTANADGKDELVIEFFIARANFLNKNAEVVTANIGGQLFADATTTVNVWQMYLENTVIKSAAWMPAEASVTWQKGYADATGNDPEVAPVWNSEKNAFTLTLPENPYTLAGHEFNGWNIVVNGGVAQLYQAGSVIELPEGATVVITADWLEIGVEYVTVTFELGCEGEIPAPKSVAKNGNVDELPAVSRGGYALLGWYVVANNELTDTEFTTEFAVVEDITVRAKWKNLADGDLENWTDAQKANPTVLTADDGRYLKIYVTMADGGVFVYYDVQHRNHVTNMGEWWKNTNVEFFFGEKDGRQYFISARENGPEINNIRSEHYFYNTAAPAAEGGFYHTIAEVYVPYEDIDGFDGTSASMNGLFAFKIDNEAGIFENGYYQIMGDPGVYLRDTSSEQEPYRRSTVFTRDGILGAQKATAMAIDGDLSDWNADEFHVSTGTKAGVTARWAAKRLADGLYAALEVKAAHIDMRGDRKGGPWWENTNIELWGGEEAAHYSGRIMNYNGETVFTSSIDDAKMIYIAGVDGAEDTLIVEFFVCSLRSRPGTTRIDIGGQLWGEGHDSWQDYARYIVF